MSSLYFRCCEMEEESKQSQSELKLLHSRHAKYFQRTLAVLPSSLASYDTQRITLLFFGVSGLDVLDGLESIANTKTHIVDWLYSCLVSSQEDEKISWSGWRGSTTIKLANSSLPSHEYDQGHIAMTYTALATLIILGDDLSRVNRKSVVAGVRALQLTDGSYRAALGGGENDMRFLYCAACVCTILNDWAGMDQDAAVDYVLASFSYEGGVGQGPGLEAHGGSTFCAVAALSLMGRLEEVGEARLESLTAWCVQRQVPGSGYMGRPNKPEDTCYSFWVGATLAILGRLDMTDTSASRNYVLSTQDPVTGGMAKWVDSGVDPLHTYMGLSGLSLQGEAGVALVDPCLNITVRAKQWLESLHKTW